MLFKTFIDQIVSRKSSIFLITPGDKNEIDLGKAVTFTWRPLPGHTESYTLRVVEIKSGQPPEHAMKLNFPIVDKRGIRVTSTQVPYIAVDEPGIKRNNGLRLTA